jgi:hypothetical protein
MRQAVKLPNAPIRRVVRIRNLTAPTGDSFRTIWSLPKGKGERMYVSVSNSQQLIVASKVSVDALLELISDQLLIEDLQDPEKPTSIDAEDFLKRIRSRLENFVVVAAAE